MRKETGERRSAFRGPGVASLVIFAGVLVMFVTIFYFKEARQLTAETSVLRVAGASMPALDQHQPEKTEKATFALG